MKAITEQQRLEIYSWHLVEQSDALADTFITAPTAEACNESVLALERFLAAVRVPEFVPQLIRRWEQQTGCKL